MLIEVEKEAFQNLIKKVDEMHAGVISKKEEPKSDWIDGQTVLKMLGVSKRTLQSFRDQGKIEFSMVSRKLIYYSKKSVEELLNRNVYKPFNQ
ncbi:MAG: hypothetical protein RL308_339 [Bacteroidota bacterium]|jgi:hypothetical protein